MNADLSILSNNRALAFAKHAKMGQNEPFFAFFPTQHGIIWSKTWQCTPWSNTFSALCRRIVQALASYCLSRGLVLSNLSRRILYLFVLWQKHPSQTKYPRSFLFFTSFRYICNIVPLLQRWCGMTLTKRCYWNYLLRSNFATLINSMKMMAVALHHLIYACPNRFEYYQFGVGYCLIRTRGNARSPRTLVSSPVVYLNNYRTSLKFV